jgi:hypothetical protein
MNTEEKLEEKNYSQKIFFFLSKTTIYLSRDDIQSTEKVFSSQKRTSSTSKHAIS